MGKLKRVVANVVWHAQYKIKLLLILFKRRTLYDGLLPAVVPMVNKGTAEAFVGNLLAF